MNKALKNYQRAAKKIFNTPSGHTVLATWKQDYTDVTALVPGDPVSTAYLLGRKEFIQEVIGHLKSEDVLDDIKIDVEE